MKEKCIQKLQPKSKRYTVKLGDSVYLRVTPSGHKSWVLRYHFCGAVRDITLGTWPEMTAAQAKQAAHLKRQELKLKPSAGLTFNDAYQLWIQKKKGSIVSYPNEVRRIELYLLPKLKHVELEKITAPMMLNLLVELQDKPATLKRVLMRLNEILDLAVCAGYLGSNPCRKLSKVFSGHTPVNRAYLPADRLGELFKLLVTEELWFHLFVLWAVYTALRPIECVSARWSWIEGDVLVVPANIMKKRRTHRIPLCPKILALLDVVKRIRPHRSVYIWCFTSTPHVHKQHLTRWLNNSALSGKLCHHGLRATLRTWMKDQDVPREVAEDALAHVSGSATERAYLRGDFLLQRTPIMHKWWQYIYKQYCAACAGNENAHVVREAVSKVYVELIDRARERGEMRRKLLCQAHKKQGGNN